jgi:hypothetical protein
MIAAALLLLSTVIVDVMEKHLCNQVRFYIRT